MREPITAIVSNYKLVRFLPEKANHQVQQKKQLAPSATLQGVGVGWEAGGGWGGGRVLS